MNRTASRLASRFASLAAENRPGLVTFLTSGDPNEAISDALLFGLPGAGADIIELGMPFSDPMADGPAIQAASQRALAGGWTLRKTLDQVRRFRARDTATPIVLMGYFNPIYRYRVGAFVADAREAGVDGLIVVDLPPEEEVELALPAKAQGLDFIYLTAPTTDDSRLPRVVRNAGGFIYYVSVTGVTGTRSADEAEVAAAVARLRRHTELPIAVGFGIKTPGQAAAMARHADAVVVGSALVSRLAENLGGDPVGAVLGLTRELAHGVRGARRQGDGI